MRASRLLAALGVLGPLSAGACGTLGAPPSADSDPPSAGVGPFRVLTSAEEPSTPLVLSNPGEQFREPSALAVDPMDPSSMRVYLYAVASVAAGAGTADVIVRTRADDGRSFYGTLLDPQTVTPPVVLAPNLSWEGKELSGPSALRVGERFYLYYAAEGGVGLATSADGLNFSKVGEPVLAPDPAATWETTTPSAPSVARLPDGTFLMMYAAGLSIGEATSPDGVHFARRPGPVFSPLHVADPPADGATPPFDTGQVSDPCVLPEVNAANQLLVRVLYTGYDGAPTDSTRSSAIGFAARIGAVGPLTRQPLPVLSIDMHEAAPAYFAWSEGELLYAQATVGSVGSSGFTSIVAGLAPATLTLPAPGPFATLP